MTNNMKWLILAIFLAGVFALTMHGCGASSSSADAEKAAGPAPRPGEDDMKKQMEILQKKGLMSKVRGVPQKK
jgi:hypothetical protein